MSHSLRARGARAGFRLAARLRRAPAFHPRGLTCTGELTVVGGNGSSWGVPWLERSGRHDCAVRLSRGAGLPGPLPDWLGLAVRVVDAGGPGRHLDLLLTTSARLPLLRHLPLPRGNALGGPYSGLLPYRVGGRRMLLAAFPRRRLRPVPGSPSGLRRALDEQPLVFDLRAAEPLGRWRTFAVLTVRAPLPEPPASTPGYDVYGHSLPGLAPGPLIATVRRAAYQGSREGRR
ncbi:phosphodiesterase [Streptomyces sp. TRM 70361]|uniref:phosphodiesterase n=1 Tax=Streptomyces sp. TRM 70361 TaxID=3116553 RepID=UPI002E7B1467|nr:phosphodiesterase [Streptomyces sp. TRM 70361]MEE1943147.1 phosphodiesterase [Streptomyces sp. TRM 70361]